ncbi:MAG: effector-associated domain EAD1-containing protein, partial [Verrucomicrobia bacterium]|nr:effector-associated domain EAD1-containing protein [Verrucomicrobiota bacterium]
MTSPSAPTCSPPSSPSPPTTSTPPSTRPPRAAPSPTPTPSASTPPECGYAWGEADALHVSGQALRALGRHAAARARFRDAADLRARIEHPGAAESLAFATELTETTPLPEDPMTIFSPAQALQFQSAILSAFPSVSSLEQAVYFGLGARLAAIVDPGSLTTQVHSLLKWAAAEGRERELLTALRAANKGNPELRAFEDSVNASPPVLAPVSPTPPPVIAPSPDVSPVASPRMATPWFRQLPIDWTRPEPRSVREALLAAYSSNPELLALAKSAGLKVSSLKHQMSAPALLVDEMLERARVADRLEQLLVEVFLNDEAAAVHAVLRDTLRGWEAVFHAAAVRRLPSLDVLSRIA